MQRSSIKCCTKSPERLSGDLVAAVPDEVAESLKEVLAEAHALERMAIDVGAGELEELLADMEENPAVQALYDKLDASAILDADPELRLPQHAPLRELVAPEEEQGVTA